MADCRRSPRFTDLAEGLPGIGSSVLTTRLKELEQSGLVVRRTLPPPAASVVYELADLGRGVGPVLAALADWGLNVLDPPRDDDQMMLATVGGVVGVAVGALITVVWATHRGWQVTLPLTAVGAGLGAAIAVGAVAVVYPALRAAGLAPTDALRAS